MNFRTLDLNLLRVFDAVMVERNVTRAAAVLAMTQPAVSNALRRLRESIGEVTLIAVLRDLERNSRSRIARRAAAIMTARTNRGFFPTFSPRIHLADRDQPFFTRYISQPGGTLLTPETDPEGAAAALLEVRDHFIAQLSTYSQAERARLCDYVLDHCEVVVILSSEIDRAYRMFIVLNERGKKLQRQ